MRYCAIAAWLPDNRKKRKTNGKCPKTGAFSLESCAQRYQAQCRRRGTTAPHAERLYVDAEHERAKQRQAAVWREAGNESSEHHCAPSSPASVSMLRRRSTATIVDTATSVQPPRRPDNAGSRSLRDSAHASRTGTEAENQTVNDFLAARARARRCIFAVFMPRVARHDLHRWG